MKLCFVLNEDISDLIDYVEHVRHLSVKHEVWLLCTGNRNQVELGSCHVEVIAAGQLPLLSMFVFFLRCAQWIEQNGSADWRVICKQARFCSLLPLRLRELACVFDLRSGSVSGFADGIKNRLLAFEAARFQHHIVIATTVADQVLGRMPNGALELGVGAKTLNTSPELRASARNDFSIGEDVFVLLYVGSLTGRKLHRFVEGLRLDDKPMLLVVVGAGADADMAQLRGSLDRSTVSYRIEGHVPYDQLSGYFAAADAGLCYVPVEPRYTYQPPTKLYEYLANGLPVLSTKTDFAMHLNPEVRDRVLLIEDQCDAATIRQWSAEVGLVAPDDAFSWHRLSLRLEQFLLELEAIQS